MVDLALAHRKPFTVVPCCVFWKRAPGADRAGERVRSWEQFCAYFAEKDAHIQVGALPIPGRIIVLYYCPPSGPDGRGSGGVNSGVHEIEGSGASGGDRWW